MWSWPWPHTAFQILAEMSMGFLAPNSYLPMPRTKKSSPHILALGQDEFEAMTSGEWTVGTVDVAKQKLQGLEKVEENELIESWFLQET